jgi:mannose-6-phosphate isomerase-like protein (cupin superfamily)
MRLALIVTFAGGTILASAQEPAAKMFASRADVVAMITKAKNQRKPDQANYIQSLLREAPCTANLEYRVQGIDTNPLSHEKEVEIIYVIEGAGTLTTGGTLRDEKRLNGRNLTGTSLEGGTPRRIAPGDFILVPENTPHAFTKTEGTLVIMSLHLPADGATK